MAHLWVIGGANIDICGASKKELRARDSNIGTIQLGYGGVGRNIAQTGALLGVSVRFVTCFSEDHFGRILRADCEKLGLDCSWSVTSSDHPCSMYIALLDRDGDMHIGMSDMRVLDALTEEAIDRAVSAMSPDDILVTDSNLSEEKIKRIVSSSPCRIAADPVSANKAPRLRNYLGKFCFFKVNDVEAEELSGTRVTNEESAKRCLDHFLGRGVKEIIVTLGGAGLYLGTEEEMRFFRHRDLNVRNTNGGGDTLLGAYLGCRISGVGPAEAIRFGMSAAALVVEDDALRERSISMQTVKKKNRTLEIKEKKI